MQKLMFESSWNKALSNKDRKVIEDAFLKTAILNSNSIQFTPLWQAFNHKDELLVTMLIHNFTSELVSFNDIQLRYLENNKMIAEHLFHLPTLVIQPSYSMPWTFIFPTSSTKQEATFKNVQMVIY
ncbi:SLAP domain-containing protein [Psychrobacillus sp.]|uniref:SLAP domain-containing protein n=1 Tax=Psychrobacillus sp. TaxID=1871623 RepID=UPI0028BDC966|nr:SLAP domain-containing protein [Psychrobacillus sp.]